MSIYLEESEIFLALPDLMGLVHTVKGAAGGGCSRTNPGAIEHSVGGLSNQTLLVKVERSWRAEADPDDHKYFTASMYDYWQ